MKRLLKKVATTKDVIHLILRIEASYFWWTLPLIFIVPALSVVTVYVPKFILEKLTQDFSFRSIVLTIVLYCGILLILRLIQNFLTAKSSLAASKFTKKLRYEVGKTTMQLELSDVESPAKQDVITLAKNAEKLIRVFSEYQKILSNVITIVTLSVIIVNLDLLLLAFTSAIIGLKAFFSVWQYVCNKRVRVKFAQNERIGNYLQGMAYFDYGAQKEIRVNSLQGWFMGKIGEYRDEMLHLQYRDFRRNGAFNIITALLTAVETLIVFVILVGKYLNDAISIADFSMYFSAAVLLASTLFALTSNFETVSEYKLFLDDYQALLRLAENNKPAENSQPKADAGNKTVFIEFKNVSFRYPGTEKVVLENINLTIRNNEKLVIVGLNGSGKTTLIKLLCKFYKPTEGKILFNGIDIWDIPNAEYYLYLGAVFQDFRNFAFSLSENISLSEEPNEEEMQTLCTRFGFDSFVSSTPNGLQTHISKVFDPSGIELSGGERQKTAILRALYKDAPVLILDEPTASLDAKTESEIYSDFFRMTENKTAIFISHRLAVSSLADHIAVFDNGRLVEYGCHSDLIRENGIYAEMYKKQSSFYAKKQATACE